MLAEEARAMLLRRASPLHGPVSNLEYALRKPRQSPIRRKKDKSQFRQPSTMRGGEEKGGGIESTGGSAGRQEISATATSAAVIPSA